MHHANAADIRKEKYAEFMDYVMIFTIFGFVRTYVQIIKWRLQEGSAAVWLQMLLFDEIQNGLRGNSVTNPLNS